MVWELFDEDARRVIVLAQEKSSVSRHSQVGTSHLLYAILRQEESKAYQALKNSVKDIEALKSDLEQKLSEISSPEKASSNVLTGYAAFTIQRAIKLSISPFSENDFLKISQALGKFLGYHLSSRNRVSQEHLVLAMFEVNSELSDTKYDAARELLEKHTALFKYQGSLQRISDQERRDLFKGTIYKIPE